jgi:hypothetical protein
LVTVARADWRAAPAPLINQPVPARGECHEDAFSRLSHDILARAIITSVRGGDSEETMAEEKKKKKKKRKNWPKKHSTP